MFYFLLMCVAGMGIPIMAALNADLSNKLNSQALAVVILFIVGGALALIYLLASEGIPRLTSVRPAPISSYLGGFFIVFYITCVTWVAPQIGVGNTIAMVLLGQMISMTIIDHYGLWGAMQFSLSKMRLLGLLLMAIGVFLVMRKN